MFYPKMKLSSINILSSVHYKYPKTMSADGAQQPTKSAQHPCFKLGENSYTAQPAFCLNSYHLDCNETKLNAQTIRLPQSPHTRLS